MKHCCDEMAYYVGHEDKILYYFENYNEYLIPVHDGGSSGILIQYCPWCGKKLPQSKREGSDEIDVKRRKNSETRKLSKNGKQNKGT